MSDMQERIAKSRNGVAKYKCMSCGATKTQVTPS